MTPQNQLTPEQKAAQEQIEMLLAFNNMIANKKVGDFFDLLTGLEAGDQEAYINYLLALREFLIMPEFVDHPMIAERLKK